VTDIRLEVERALATLPTSAGGIALLLAIAGDPPPVVLLSAGDVVLDGASVRIALYAASSAARVVGDSATLLVPVNDGAVRIEIGDIRRRGDDRFAVIEGVIGAFRPTAEPPWRPRLVFEAAGPGTESFVAHWGALRAWLASGATGESPPLPPGTA